MELDELWNEVDWKVESEGGLALGNLKLIRSDATLNGQSILIGVDSDSARHLLVPATGENEGQVDDASKGIRVEVQPFFKGDGSTEYYCDISCEIPGLNPLFTVVAEDMVKAVQEAPEEPVFETCIETLESWRTLLEQKTGDGLSRKEVAGLLGELVVVRKLAAHTDDVLDRWKGPDGAHHDLTADEIDIEVKTSTRQTDRKIHIQSLSQLESTKEQFYLHYVRLAPTGSDGITVPGLVDELVAAGVPRSPLQEKLVRVGYLPQDRDEYEDLEFEVLEDLTYRADGPDFPRITRDDLQNGVPDCVKGINYEIDLDCVAAEPLSKGEVEQVLTDMAQQE